MKCFSMYRYEIYFCIYSETDIQIHITIWKYIENFMQEVFNKALNDIFSAIFALYDRKINFFFVSGELWFSLDDK